MLLKTIMAMKIRVTGDTCIATRMSKLSGGMNDNDGTGLCNKHRSMELVCETSSSSSSSPSSTRCVALRTQFQASP